MDIENIARLCHQANKALCEAFGDHSQKDWEAAPDWQRSSAINGVEFVLASPGAPASASHDNWLAVKRADGWVWGPVKDVEAKTHPCIAPFEALPPEQQAKDHVFRAIVEAHR